MSNRLIFRCNSCGCDGTIKVADEYEICVCPACGNSLDVDTDDEEDDE